MEKITNEQISIIKNLWEGNTKLEEWVKWENIECIIRENGFELIKIWSDFKMLLKVLNIKVNTIKNIIEELENRL